MNFKNSTWEKTILFSARTGSLEFKDTSKWRKWKISLGSVTIYDLNMKKEDKVEYNCISMIFLPFMSTETYSVVD